MLGDPYPGAADPFPAPTQQEMVIMLMQFTGVTDEGVARRVLQDHRWDANAAAQFLLASNGQEIMEVTIPQRVSQERKILVCTPRGECTVDVPSGLHSGDVMTFKLPLPDALPEVAVARPVGLSADCVEQQVRDPYSLPCIPESRQLRYSVPNQSRGHSTAVAPAGTMPPAPGRQFRFL